MKKLTILCDADDTIQELTVHWLAELNRKYNYNVKKEDVTSWDITKAYPELTPDEVLEPLYSNEFWNKTTPIDGSSYGAKTKKLMEMFPFLTKEQIIRENNKQRIMGDVLIDDGVHNLIGGRYKKFLFNQPNNSGFNEQDYDITRVYSWKDIYERISNFVA